MTPAYARKKDMNHNLLVAEYQALGWEVTDLFQCAAYVAGIADFVAERTRGPHDVVTLWIEVKKDEKEPLTAPELAFRLRHPENYRVQWCVEQVHATHEEYTGLKVQR